MRVQKYTRFPPAQALKALFFKVFYKTLETCILKFEVFSKGYAPKGHTGNGTQENPGRHGERKASACVLEDRFSATDSQKGPQGRLKRDPKTPRTHSMAPKILFIFHLKIKNLEKG